ncbi:hypothetical protein [Streptococcus suis]|uniref:hypothetical protein n=1 Tax=Streptococcus suis TaxID=1307 RepID=UPI000428495D|nr:hypothetical protein [Streptococcus suis]HEM3179512.1 hypothetical protein [Streptococcus suis 92-4172]
MAKVTIDKEELKETAFELLAIAESLRLHQVGADTIYSLRSVDTELFNYHAKEYVSAVFDTLKNESNFLREIADRLLKKFD